MTEMENQNNAINPDIQIKSEEKPNEFTKPSISFIPNITKTIGRGEDARNSFIYLTIRYAFIAAVIITILCVLNHWFFREEEKIPNITDDIQIIWDIAVPLITLALGYAFGRAKD